MSTENSNSAEAPAASAPPPATEAAAGTSQTAGGLAPRPPLLKRMRDHLGWRITIPVLALILAFPAWRALKARGREQGRPDLTAPALPSVAVARVLRQDLYNEVTIPAEFRPYEEVELHAKVSGYVKELPVDIGDRVKKGQLLATLEIPELQDQLDGARAAFQRAQADHQDAHLNYTRLLAVDKDHPNLVAQQDLDNAQARDSTTEAAIAAANSEVERYQTMVDYTRITAPFDGVVTRRYVDPGALIQSGTASSTQSLPLVRVSDNYRLRLDFPVSVDYVSAIQLGTPVEVRVESLGGKSFAGKIARCTGRVDEATRTMITEIEVPNENLELVPGMYASVVLKMDRHPSALAIPTQAVLGGARPAVYLVNAGHQIEERRVTLGIETPNQYEVLSGLKEGDLVFLGNRSEIKPGEKVETKLINPRDQE